MDSGTLACCSMLAVACTAQSMAPDGGPWAPVLIDMASVAVSPRVLEPGRAVTVKLTCRPGQASKITRLRLAVQPLGFEMDVTDALDRGAGAAQFTIPKGTIRLEGKFSLRLYTDFRWDDGKVYHRAPPFGEIEVRAFAGWQYTDETFAGDLRTARASTAEAEALLRKQAKLPRLASLLDQMNGWIEKAKHSLASDDHPQAKKWLARTVWEGKTLKDRLPLVEYRFDVSHYLTTHQPTEKPLLTVMSGSFSSDNIEDFEKVRWLGCDTVVHGGMEALSKLKAAGFRTVHPRSPARYSAKWADRRPAHRQERYLMSDAVQAASKQVVIDPLAGHARHHYEIDKDHPPKTYWRVYDASEGRALPPEAWSFDPEREVVCIPNAEPGHEYEVAALVYCSSIPFFGKYADPVHRGCEQAVLRRLTQVFAEHAAHLDVYRPTSLYYPFPLMEMERGKKRFKWHNWYGYQWGTGPHAQKLFEERTGLKFDPAWLVNGRRYGGINYPPPREYLRWMTFQQQNVNRFFKKVVDLAHKHGVKVRPFWGDHWMGMEPHLSFFAETGTDEIVKACGSDVVVRMVTDIPADCQKIIRFSPWLDWGELFRHRHALGRLESRWRLMKRALLFRVTDGLTWGGQTQTVALKDERIAQKMKDITDEFRLIHALTHGQEVFRHDLTLYLANAWGKVRSWPGWADVNESQRILTHLTDLPVHVRFISLSEIAETGVPDDADVILNCGEPGSAWSGGHFWKDDRLVRAIESFVANGRGFIGIGAPSHTGDGVWRLSGLMGVAYAGTTDRGAERGIFNRYDTWRVGGKRASWRTPMKRTSAPHWITETSAPETEPVRANVTVKQLADDVGLLCSADGKTFASPVVTVRERSGGRVVYLNGYATSSDYGSLLHRAIFWAARKERLFRRLHAESPDVRTYLYPKKQLLILYNMAAETRTTRVRLDVSLVSVSSERRCRLVDVFREETIAIVPGHALRAGFELSVTPRAMRFIEIRSEPPE